MEFEVSAVRPCRDPLAAWNDELARPTRRRRRQPSKPRVLIKPAFCAAVICAMWTHAAMQLIA